MDEQQTATGSGVDSPRVFESAFLHVRARTRYWEDASVNGVEDLSGELIPLRQGDSWCPVIDLRSGVVQDWPRGVTADVHYKVCDQGDYWLATESRVKTHKYKSHYVPDAFLCHGDRGYGDYIIMQIGADGRIVDFVPPTICEQEWIALPNNGDSWVLGLKKQPKLEGVSEPLR